MKATSDPEAEQDKELEEKATEINNLLGKTLLFKREKSEPQKVENEELLKTTNKILAEVMEVVATPLNVADEEEDCKCILFFQNL